MLDSSMVGTRIRERRVMAGLKQAELAQNARISASYLNLIEHNKRRIGGRTLLQIAQALDVEPSLLSEGAGAHLLTGLKEAAAGHTHLADDALPELDRVEEFAGRFPGWAGLLARLNSRCDDMERTIKELTERLAHDPQLAEALHEVISTATSIRATAAILAETRELEPEWQMRFHRNINEDGQRLSEGAESLMRYLEAAPDAGAEIRSSWDELHLFLQENAFHFSQLEGWGGASRVDALTTNSNALASEQSRAMAQGLLMQIADDARALPLDDMQELLERFGAQPDRIARETGQTISRVMRRLAFLPEDVVGVVGLVVVDGAGALLLRKPALSFTSPRNGAACPLWPVYEGLTQPGRPIRRVVRQGDLQLEALSFTEEAAPVSFDTPPLVHGYMLLRPLETNRSSADLIDVGVTCQICVKANCPARREPSILRTPA